MEEARGKHGHVLERETNSIARADHTPMCGCWLMSQRPSVETKDSGEFTREARVGQ
jgi:hypothetical protein